MPFFYNDLRPAADYRERDYALVFPSMEDAEKLRVIDNLLRLKQGLAEELPLRKTGHSLLMASWNLKEFGHNTQRLTESYFYIAEVISHFDLVAVQEVKSTLKDLDQVMRLLGSEWEYIINDITEGSSGNDERSAYIFNRTRLHFGGLAGEVVLWDELTRNSSLKQLKRTPFVTGFKAGWKQFALINLHLHPGDDEEDMAMREQEVSLLLEALREKQENNPLWSDNLVLVGDFNFYTGETRDDALVEMIHNAGFSEVQSLVGVDTNVSNTEAYDRFFIYRNEYFQICRDAAGQDIGGVFNPFRYVFVEEEHAGYKEMMQAVYTGSKDLNDADNLHWYFMNHWRKNQLSDHLPIWFELQIDSSSAFLQRCRDAMD